LLDSLSICNITKESPTRQANVLALRPLLASSPANGYLKLFRGRLAITPNAFLCLFAAGSIVCECPSPSHFRVPLSRRRNAS